MPRLKNAQYWILHNVLNCIPHHEAVHGFRKQHSILTNAAGHVGKEVVVNIDIKDFFPSIDFKRVKGLFVKLGYSEKIATIFSLLCTRAEVEEVELDGKNYFVATGERNLPQGAPTSPAITNILCYKLDCRLQGIAKAMGFRYTRYADDITFSGNKEVVDKVQQLLWRLKKTITEEGFVVHPKKIKVMRKGARQEVTGIVVNKQAGINRQTLHRFRALLHNIEKGGLANKTWKGGNIVAEITGYANFVTMVKPALGLKLKQQVQQVLNHPSTAEYINAMQTQRAEKTVKSVQPQQNSLFNANEKEKADKPWWNVL